MRDDGIVEVTLIDTEDLAAGGDGLRAARAVESGELTPLAGGESLTVTKYNVTLSTPLQVPVAGHADWVDSRKVLATLVVR